MKQLYSVNETLEYLNIGRTYFYQLLSERRIIAVKIGKRTFVPNDEINKFVSNLPRYKE